MKSFIHPTTEGKRARTFWLGFLAVPTTLIGFALALFFAALKLLASLFESTVQILTLGRYHSHAMSWAVAANESTAEIISAVKQVLQDRRRSEGRRVQTKEEGIFHNRKMPETKEELKQMHDELGGILDQARSQIGKGGLKGAIELGIKPNDDDTYTPIVRLHTDQASDPEEIEVARPQDTVKRGLEVAEQVNMTLREGLSRLQDRSEEPTAEDLRAMIEWVARTHKKAA